jgi:hypothetical protein
MGFRGAAGGISATTVANVVWALCAGSGPTAYESGPLGAGGTMSQPTAFPQGWREILDEDRDHSEYLGAGMRNGERRSGRILRILLVLCLCAVTELLVYYATGETIQIADVSAAPGDTILVSSPHRPRPRRLRPVRASRRSGRHAVACQRPQNSLRMPRGTQ